MNSWEMNVSGGQPLFLPSPDRLCTAVPGDEADARQREAMFQHPPQFKGLFILEQSAAEDVNTVRHFGAAVRRRHV